MTNLRAAYSSPWIPAPVVKACSFTPMPIYGSEPSKHPAREPASREGTCPWAQSFAGHVSEEKFDAVIMTTTCDQMRRTAESLEGKIKAPLFLLTVPSTCTTSALHLYQSEILRLASFLCGISGTSLSALNAAKLRSFCMKEACFGVRRLDAALINGESAAKDTPPQPAPRTHAGKTHIPLCILGSHLPLPFEQFKELLHEYGGFVAVNGMETGPAFAPDIELTAASGSVKEMISSIAEQYFFSIKDAFRRPNTAFYRWLSVEIKREMPKGIILARNCWCDQWSVEGVRIREWSKRPMLELEFTSNTLSLSALSRLEAFMETCNR